MVTHADLNQYVATLPGIEPKCQGILLIIDTIGRATIQCSSITPNAWGVNTASHKWQASYAADELELLTDARNRPSDFEEGTIPF